MLVRSGYGPSHTWEGHRGNGGCGSTAGVASALCHQAERLQGVFSRVDLGFLYGRTQFGGGEGVSARKRDLVNAAFNPPAVRPVAPGEIVGAETCVNTEAGESGNIGEYHSY